MDAMETTTTKPTDYENIAVGHAGLYAVEPEVLDATAVSNILPLGAKGGGKTLIHCEEQIKGFVASCLAKKDEETLSKYGLTKSDVEHLPDKETGVWVHYLTQGIMRDFNLTWEKTPVCLQERKTKLERDIIKGKRVLSKKEKNELLKKTEWNFWSGEVSSGAVSREEAFQLMAEAISKVEELKEQGVYLSPNKTEGVKFFDWKSVVEETTNLVNGYRAYTRNKIEIIVPSIIENIYNPAYKVPKKQIKELLKSDLINSVLDLADKSGIKDYGVYDTSEGNIQKGGLENFHIDTLDDLMEFYGEVCGRELDMKEIKNAYKINAVHLVKLKVPGNMKPRYVCWDITNKKTNERLLKLMYRGSTATYKDVDNAAKIEIDNAQLKRTPNTPDKTKAPNADKFVKQSESATDNPLINAFEND